MRLAQVFNMCLLCDKNSDRFRYRHWKPLRYRMHPVYEWLSKEEWYSDKIVRESEAERHG
jgi:hypothetical protein